MILWVDGSHDVREQMRRDTALLRVFEDGAAVEALLRVYCFRPAGITLGLAQRAGAVLDLEACRSHGVRWAPRPTGGRAVFHAQEWTYALCSRIDDAEWGGSLRLAYARASRLVCDALRATGIPAERAPGRRESVATPRAPACFAATARHEITLDGRKLVGSAQRRMRRALLQQGSVLTGPAHAQLARYLRNPEARAGTEVRLLAEAADPGPRWHDAPLDRFASALSSIAPMSRVVLGDDGLGLLAELETHHYAGREDRTGTQQIPPHKELRA